MKKILAIVMVLSVFAGQAVAGSYRENRNEINVMYGKVSVPGTASVLAAALTSVSSSSMTMTVTGFKNTGSMGLEYFHYTQSGTWAFGVAAVYEKSSMDLTFKDTQNSKTGTTGFSMNFITVMPSVKLQWFNTNVVGMYSKVALGASVMAVPKTIDVVVDGQTQKESLDRMPSVLPAFQANPICIEVGGKNVRGFLETGWGMQGLVMGGLRINL